jgi:hypothetical protein
MNSRRREFCTLVAGGFALLSGCTAADDIARGARAASKYADRESSEISESKSDSVLYHEYQQIFLQAGQVYGEVFESVGNNRLEFTVQGLSIFEGGGHRCVQIQRMEAFQGKVSFNR